MHDHLVNHFGFLDFHKLVWTQNTSVAYENHSFCDYTLEENQKAAMWQDLVIYVNRLMPPFSALVTKRFYLVAKQTLS